MAVDRCVCLDVSFRRLLALHRERAWGFERLRAETGCATGCALCEPYIRIALRTGAERLPVLTDEQVREALASRSEPASAGCADRNA